MHASGRYAEAVRAWICAPDGEGQATRRRGPTMRDPKEIPAHPVEEADKGEMSWIRAEVEDAESEEGGRARPKRYPEEVEKDWKGMEVAGSV